MKLYFVRHGRAEAATTSDFDRALTQRGVGNTQAMARMLTRMEVAPDVIYSSPRLRARQTAEIIGEGLGVEVDIREELDFGFNAQVVEVLLRELPPDADVMFVGHEPTMSSVINALTGARVKMKKGSFARVDPVATLPLRGVKKIA